MKRYSISEALERPGGSEYPSRGRKISEKCRKNRRRREAVDALLKDDE